MNARSEWGLKIDRDDLRENLRVVVSFLFIIGGFVIIALVVLAILGIFPSNSEPTVIQTPWGPLTLPRLGPEPHLPTPSNSTTEPPPFGTHDFPDHFP